MSDDTAPDGDEAKDARTLVEAYLFISLTVSATAGVEDDVARDYRSSTALTETDDAWSLKYHGPGPEISLRVPYAGEAEARRSELMFGSGVSSLIDAGQWVRIGIVYARRALRSGLHFALDPSDDERFLSIVQDWEFARDAEAEAVKFLGDAAELPAAAIWTEMGARLRRREPERFTRARMYADIDFYQRSLDEFWRQHGGGSGGR